MKKLMLAMALVAGFATVRLVAQAADSATLSYAEARSQIGAAIDNPTNATAVIRQLASADQVKFLADLNKAIDDMPASDEEKAAKFLNVDHAALRGAAEGNVSALLAEVFATVPPEALTVINERFATDLVNRAADPNVTYTDEQYVNIAKDLMQKVNARTAEADAASVRSGFAALMMIRAANGSPANLVDTMIDALPTDEAKELAKSEWFPAALPIGDHTKSYDPMLASADAGRRPDYDQVLVVAGPQFLDGMLADMIGKNTDPKAQIDARTPILDAMRPTMGLTHAHNPNPPQPPLPPPPPYPYQSTRY